MREKDNMFGVVKQFLVERRDDRRYKPFQPQDEKDFFIDFGMEHRAEMLKSSDGSSNKYDEDSAHSDEVKVVGSIKYLECPGRKEEHAAPNYQLVSIISKEEIGR